MLAGVRDASTEQFQSEIALANITGTVISMTTTAAYCYLLLAIMCEVVATTSLKLCDGFTRPLPSIAVITGYSAAFYLLSLTLKHIPIGIAYAVWCGVGIVLIGMIGWIYFKQHLDMPALVGIGLIMAGVLVINLFSRSI